MKKLFSTLLLSLMLIAPSPAKAMDSWSAGIIGMTLGVIVGSTIPRHHLYHPYSHYDYYPGSYMHRGHIILSVPPYPQCVWIPVTVNEQFVGYYKDCR